MASMRRFSGLPRWRRHALLGSALVAACTLSDRTGPNSDVTDLMITPSSVALATSQSVQLRAEGHTTGGGIRSVQVSWSATGGAIDANGRYTADTTVGDFDVTATLDNPHLTASAKIQVRGSLRQVVLVPADATLGTSGTLQFQTYGVTANGDSVAVSPTFTATSGTISPSGLYTAPGSDGTARVIATAVVKRNGQTVADTSQVAVGSGSAVPVASVEVTPASASIGVNATVQLTATPKDANGTPLGGRTITWTTSSAGIATVSTSGLVSGVAAGSAMVTASSEGQSGASAITVTAGTPGASVVFVGAGDISDCGNNNDEATAQLLDNIAGTVFTTGDNVYSSGTATEFSQCYDPTWGRHKGRTRPAPGNHDYSTSGAAPYYAYFGSNAGPSGRGYYSFDLGDWHIVSLNSEVSMSAGSAQETWLRADLAASTKQCTLAYWHKPRFSSGSNHGSLSSAEPLWQALYDFHAEIVLAGHEHNYERFAPQTPSGQAAPADGIREFVVGTGGRSHYGFGTPIANSEVRNGDTYGVLKLTLGSGTYSWEFVPVAGQSFTDSGSGSCH